MFVKTKEIYEVTDEEVKLTGSADNYTIEVELSINGEFLVDIKEDEEHKALKSKIKIESITALVKIDDRPEDFNLDAKEFFNIKQLQKDIKANLVLNKNKEFILKDDLDYLLQANLLKEIKI
jgi:phage-related protein